MPMGYAFRRKWKYFILVNKVIGVINKCPDCLSSHTHHKVAQDCNMSENVFRTSRHESKQFAIFEKYDLCLDCGNEFYIEIFFYEKQNILKYWLKRLL